MFVGHGLVAVAIVASLAHAGGMGRDRALILGALAAGFATILDIDVIYPIVAVVLEPMGLWGANDAIWSLSTVTHRGATHSLLVALAVTIVATTWAAHSAVSTDRAGRRATAALGMAAALVCAGLVGTATVVSGTITAVIVAILAGAAILLVSVGVGHGFGPVALGTAAAIGLVSHPFGDLFIG